MIYLILDTNIWLYLAKGFDSITGNLRVGDDQHFEIFNRLKRKSEYDEFKILINEIIIKEWKRNKHHLNEHIKDLQEEEKTQLRKLTCIKDSVDPKLFKSRLNEIQSLYKHKIKLNLDHIEAIENFMRSSCLKLEIEDKLKLELADLAINKEKAPFLGSKNNFADAAILFSSADFLKENLITHQERALFVSNNYKEFGKSNDSMEFHPDLQERLYGSGLEYHRHLYSLLDLTEDMQYEIEYFIDNIRESTEYFTCMMPNCEGRNDYSPFGYLNEKVRVLKSRYDIDPNQLQLFDLNVSIEMYSKYVRSGTCSLCSTNHLECPSCESLMVDLNEDHQYYCNECYELFQVDRCPRHGDSVVYPLNEEDLHL